jgi:hypothetical protein
LFDFRYHTISLVAVFLALGIGILLGVTIGDSLVSEADRGLRQSLRQDVVEAREEEEQARRGLERRDELLERALPTLLRGRLARERVAIVGVGSLPEGLEAAVRAAVELAGGEIDSVSEVPVDFRELSESVGAREAAPRAMDQTGDRLGHAVVEGGRRVPALREELGDRFSGTYKGAKAVVFHGVPPDADEAETARPWEASLISGLTSAGATVVGVEQSGPESASQVPFYADEGIASVDSVDTPGGRAALVFALAGAKGRFGFKETADDVAPDLPPPRVRTRR